MTKTKMKIAKKYMKKNSLYLKSISYWSIFILSSIAFATSFAHASADLTLEILIHNPEVVESSTLVISGYLPKF